MKVNKSKLRKLVIQETQRVIRENELINKLTKKLPAVMRDPVTKKAFSMMAAGAKKGQVDLTDLYKLGKGLEAAIFDGDNAAAAKIINSNTFLDRHNVRVKAGRMDSIASGGDPNKISHLTGKAKGYEAPVGLSLSLTLEGALNEQFDEVDNVIQNVDFPLDQVDDHETSELKRQLEDSPSANVHAEQKILARKILDKGMDFEGMPDSGIFHGATVEEMDSNWRIKAGMVNWIVAARSRLGMQGETIA